VTKLIYYRCDGCNHWYHGEADALRCEGEDTDLTTDQTIRHLILTLDVTAHNIRRVLEPRKDNPLSGCDICYLYETSLHFSDSVQAEQAINLAYQQTGLPTRRIYVSAEVWRNEAERDPNQRRKGGILKQG
jgi:hypothetical protein